VTRTVVFTFLAAFVAFAVVQDRVTAAGARRYVELQREALRRGGTASGLPTIDEVMAPAVEASVRQGLLAGGAVLVAGLSASALVRRRARE
jgi:hypothetical protein